MSPIALRNRSATEVLADRPTMNLVAEAVAKATGLDYLTSLEHYQNRLEALGPEATVGDVLGGDAAEILPTVKLLEAYGQRTQRMLDADLLKASGGATVLHGRVMIAPDTDTAPWLANPEEFERRLRRIRVARADGTYHGDAGAKHFKKDDREAVEQGWDLVGTSEFQDAERQARARAQAEASRLQSPLDQTTALRQERLKLEAELKTLDRTIEAEDAERKDLRRRGVWRAGLAQDAGTQLARRREVSTRLEQITADKTLQLDSLPGWRFMAEQPDEPAVKLLEQEFTRESAAKLQRQLDTASAYSRQHPDVPFVKALEMAEQGKIVLARPEADGGSRGEIHGPLMPVGVDQLGR